MKAMGNPAKIARKKTPSRTKPSSSWLTGRARRMTRTHRISSARPWSSRRAAVRGMTALNRYIGNGTTQILNPVRSPISQANRASTTPAYRMNSRPGKKKSR